MDWNLFFASGTRVLALPNWESSRLLLPAHRIDERWTNSSFYPAYRFRAKLYRLLLRARAAAGCMEVRVACSSNDWPMGGFIHDVLPDADSVLVRVRKSHLTEKATVQLQDKQGRIVGYMKYAENGAASDRLSHEWRMMQAAPRDLRPELLKYGSVGGGKAFITKPLTGRSLGTKVAPPPGAIYFVKSMTRSLPVCVETHPWIRMMRELENGRPEQFDGLLETLARRHWPVVMGHGDFAPWNLVEDHTGTIRAYDWEHSTLAGFPYIDLIYYILQVSGLVRRWKPEKAARYAMQYLTSNPEVALSEVEARALTRLTAYAAYTMGLGRFNARLQAWRLAVWEGET